MTAIMTDCIEAGWLDLFVPDSPQGPTVVDIYCLIVSCARCTISRLAPGYLTHYRLPNYQQETHSYRNIHIYLHQYMSEPRQLSLRHIHTLLIKNLVSREAKVQLSHPNST